MKIYCLFAFLFTCVGLSHLQAQPPSRSHRAVTANPVIDADFPDPTVIRVNDVYYAYATQATRNGRLINIQTASSADLFHWHYMGDALPQKPAWASRTQDFWAPHVLYDSSLKKYVLFFCAKANDTSVNMGIGVGFSNEPAGPFVAENKPLMTAKGFGDIDPMAMRDPQTGKKVIYWGSGFEPIKVQQLSDNWTSLQEGTSAKNVMLPHKEGNYTNLIEGAWVDYHKGKYYLFYSGDNCCGDKANYAVMIARADSAFGPFITLSEDLGKANSVILEKDSTWLAPGHNSIVSDKRGNQYIAYHAIWKDPEKAGTPSGKDHYLKRVMCIKPIRYENGWPVVVN